MGMLDEVAAAPTLRAAMEAAVRNRGGPGADGVSVAAFAAQAHHELASLRQPASFDAEADSLRAWRLCSDCQHVAQAHGVGPAVARPGAPLVV